MELPLLSISNEDIGVRLNDSDLYVINCLSQSIKYNKSLKKVAPRKTLPFVLHNGAGKC
jgi:hypothetical protein